MDTINSFKGYGKVDPAEEQAFRRKTRKRIIILAVSAVLLVGLVIGIVAGTVIHKKNKNDGSGSGGGGDSTRSTSKSVQAICSVTEYKDSSAQRLHRRRGRRRRQAVFHGNNRRSENMAELRRDGSRNVLGRAGRNQSKFYRHRQCESRNEKLIRIRQQQFGHRGSHFLDPRRLQHSDPPETTGGKSTLRRIPGMG
nr:pectinesterase 3-like [Ipomoea batatas]